MDSLGDKLLHLLPRNTESSGIEMNTVYVCIDRAAGEASEHARGLNWLLSAPGLEPNPRAGGSAGSG